MANPFLTIINQSLPEPQASLLNGILFGVKSSFPLYFYQALIATGTIHIIALSGQNISILTKIISDISSPLGRKNSVFISLFGIIAFVTFVGLETTLIRAAIMGSMSLLAVYFGRKNWSLLSLILAGGVMLIINPAWIDDISFQLSFLATLGIILFSQIDSQKSKSIRQEILREIKTDLRTTLSAQVFTIPIIFFHFQRLSLISPLSNILIGWTIAPIMILGFMLCLLGWLFLPLGQLVGIIVWVPLSYLTFIVEFTAKLPLSSITF